MGFLWWIVLAAAGALALGCAWLLKLWLEAERKLAVAEAQLGAWQNIKAQSIEAAKAASLETAGELSKQLIAHHKAETESARQLSEKQVQKTTEALVKQVAEMGEKLTTLHTHHSENAKQVTTLWKALSTPAGAGKLNEIGLENSLKNLGLEPGRDFIMQYTIQESGNRLRPDAVIFLPQDIVMVVDCKASKALLELAETDGTPDYEAALARFAQSMKKHVGDLASRDYEAAIHAASKQSGRSQVRHVINVMYLPHDAAIEHIRRATPDLLAQCEKQKLILATSTHLSGLLSLAGTSIGLGKQDENQQRIIQATQEILDGIITSFSHLEKVGSGIKSAMTAFDNFARSANRYLLPKAQKVTQMGVKQGKNKELPVSIKTYEVRERDDTMLIEGESETTPLKLVNE